MYSKKFYLSWIICAVVMYLMSYAWHGLVLNDLAKLDYPRDVYLGLSALAYLIVGFILTLLVYQIPDARSSYLNGLKVGVICGVVIYLLAFVFGISFKTAFDIKVILFDLGWQSVEQGAGGIISGFVYRVLYARERYLNSE